MVQLTAQMYSPVYDAQGSALAWMVKRPPGASRGRARARARSARARELVARENERFSVTFGERTKLGKMAAPIVLLLSLLLLVTGGAAWNPEISDEDDPSKTYNFLAIGDWGDDSADQHANAAGMGVVAEEIDAALVIALGDNFYHSSNSHCDTSGGHYGGICNNNTDGIDGIDRFKATFEQVYTAESLRRIPWYAIAGNHDHAGNVTAQIAYTTNAQNSPLPDEDGLPAKRWNFPNYFYNVTKHFEVPGSGGKTVELEFLLFDSSIMAGNPADPTTAAAQLKWLEERMAASTADYLWVGAHYPVWAIGQDPPTGINPILRPLLHKWEANYFNGHEHDLEHIVEQGSKVNYICTGAGKFCCYADKNLDTVPQGSIQFAMSGGGGTDWWGRRPWTPPEFELLAGFVRGRSPPPRYRALSGYLYLPVRLRVL
eukprot:COSAG02_NODE_439_length_22308_cov_18.013508_17_plen_430_part_00